MPAHPVFTDIVLHSDDELGQLLGSAVEERETIHAWPLSCVQAVRLRDGSRLAYKSQLPPTVEPEFYAAARSPLLPRCHSLGALGSARTIALEWIDSQLLGEVASDDRALLDHGRRVVAQICEIQGLLPTYMDIASVDSWMAVGEVVFARWEKVIANRWFTRTDLDAVARVRSWAASAPVLAAVDGHCQVIHGDLKADQVFVGSDGYRVIDWQRPVCAPPEVDLVSLLVGQGTVPATINPAFVGIFWFLRLHWAVEAQYQLFPGGRWPLFDSWACEAATSILDQPAGAHG